MLDIEICQDTLWLHFQDWMCAQDDGKNAFWKKDAKTSLLSLRSMHSTVGEAHRLPWSKCSFYCECCHALNVFFLDTSRLLWELAIVKRGIISGVSRGGGCLQWSNHNAWFDDGQVSLHIAWMPELKCLTNNEISLTWLMIQNTLWVGKKSFTAKLVTSPECIQCGGIGSIEPTFITAQSCACSVSLSKATCFSYCMNNYLS